MKKIKSAIAQGQYLVAAQVLICKAGRTLVDEYIQNLRSAKKRLELIQSGNHTSITVESLEDAFMDLVVIFDSHEDLNNFNPQQGINPRDLALVRNSKDEFADLELTESQGNIFGTQDNLDQNIQDDLEERAKNQEADFNHDYSLASEATKQLTAGTLTGDQYDEILNDAKNKQLVCNLINSNTKGVNETYVNQTEYLTGGNSQVPKKLPLEEFNISDCVVLETEAPGRYKLYVPANNQEFIAKSCPRKSKISLEVKDRETEIIIKCAELSKSTFNLEIMSQISVKTGEKKFSLISIENPENIIKNAIENLKGKLNL